MGIDPTKKVVVRIHARASTRSYQIGHLIHRAKAVEEILGTLSAFVQTGLSLAYLADQAHLAYKARQIVVKEQEEEAEDAEVVSEMQSLVEKIDIATALKQARKGTIRFQIPEDEPDQQDQR